MPIGRRVFLISSAALAAAACRRPAPRSPTPARDALPPVFDRWDQEAHGMLSDGLDTLRAFDVFHAFRVSIAAQSSTRLGAELAWDPPSSAVWDQATHVTSGLHGRAEQLFRSVTTTKIDSSLWREQRALADAVNDMVEFGDRLGAYRNRVDVLPPGDAANAFGLLDQAWAQWDTAAARWGVGRSEAIACAS